MRSVQKGMGCKVSRVIPKKSSMGRARNKDREPFIEKTKRITPSWKLDSMFHRFLNEVKKAKFCLFYDFKKSWICVIIYA